MRVGTYTGHSVRVGDIYRSQCEGGGHIQVTV